MRESRNEIVNGIVKNGFDYDLQVWIEDYIIISHELIGIDIRIIQIERTVPVLYDVMET